MKRPENFWKFSLETYARPGVADSCIALQDKYGVDVNILLFCCWFGCTRGTLPESMLDEALAFSEPWSTQVVRPLRQARRWMKDAGCNEESIHTESCLDLRERIKKIELDAEHLQQSMLETITSSRINDALDADTMLNACASNLSRYLGRQGVRIHEESLLNIEHILNACGFEMNQRRVHEAISNALQTTAG